MSGKWGRAMAGDTVVVDTRAPMLFWVEKFPVPSYAFAKADVRMDLLLPRDDGPVDGSFFHLPKRAVARWVDLHVAGRVSPHAAWVLDDPAVSERIVFNWQSGIVERWLEEDEEVRSHPRDPHKRVEALPSSRHVSVALDGVTLADTSHPVLLFETYPPTRFYFLRSDVDLGTLSSSANRSHCPYKACADEYWDAPEVPGVAWSYPHPYPAVGAIEGRIACYNESVDTTVEDVLVPRPVSYPDLSHRPWSRA